MQHIHNFTHAVMFHHFHDDRHPAGQGALSATQFEDMIDWLQERYNLIAAEEYQHKLINSKLAPKDICFTFDDALLCQYDIALPILKKRKISAYFFIYSSPFSGTPDFLEIYRYFRTTCFISIDQFYDEFFRAASSTFAAEYHSAAADFQKSDYLGAYPFYTENDKWFRYLRDMTLGKVRYAEIMELLMASHNFVPESVMKDLWMNEKCLLDLINDGHTIGLHSFTHPTTMHMLSRKQQEEEYTRNYRHLTDLLGIKINSMSHPCGNYNADTLQLLQELNIEIGFRSNNSVQSINSALEIPREDHANVLKEMTK